MELIHIRFNQTPDSTIGRYFLGKFECYCLEDGFRDPKEYGKTRIPAGRYPLVLREHGGFYERYTREYKQPHPVLEIKDVPGFTDVLIHKGNLVTDTLGCHLLGTTYTLQNGVYQVAESKKAYDKFHEVIVPLFEVYEHLWIVIKEDL